MAYLQSTDGRLAPEEALLAEEMGRRGVTVRLFTPKQVFRGQLPLSRDCLVSGDGQCVAAALHALGIPAPEPLDYPECLREHLHRRLWTSTVGKLTGQVLNGGGPPVFAKPARRAKRFTGRVFESHDDLRFLQGTSQRAVVWCSTPVTWRSEWRVYVLGGRILATRHYSGDSRARIDGRVVREMVRNYTVSAHAPAAYALDVGLLDGGETALVEVNDAMSLGAYGIDARPYTELILARWRQLTGYVEVRP